MKSRQVTFNMPEDLYEQLNQIAQASGWTIESVIVQTLRGGMPPSLKKVPSAFHRQLLGLNGLDDRQLWDVIADKSPQVELPNAELNVDDFVTLRRAYAFQLLKWRGHPMPSPHEMML